MKKTNQNKRSGLEPRDDEILKGEIDDINGIFDSNPINGRFEIVKFLLKKHDFLTVTDKNSEDLYIYDNGIYREIGVAIIKKEVEEILQELYSIFHVNDIIEKVKVKTSIDREKFTNEDDDLICLENGILNIKTKKLIPHTPDIIFTSKIPISYKPKANCPEIKKFLKNILYKEDINVIQEWFGFCLLKNYLFKKAMIIFGEGDTSKTTLLNLLVKFIGEANISNINLHQLATSRFHSAKMYKKLVNVYDDLDFKDVIGTGYFKMACGKATMGAERKYKDLFFFYNYAKLVFTANKIPQLKDKDASDSAYYSRWIIIRCDNVLKRNQVDPDYINKIITPEELSGLLNYALKGLKRLLKQGYFSYDKTWEEIKEIMERSGSSLSAFAQDELIEQQNNWISKDNLYNTYAKYASIKKLPAMTKLQLSKNISRFAHYIIDGRDKTGEFRGWRNVDFKSKKKTTNPMTDKDNDNKLKF